MHRFSLCLLASGLAFAQTNPPNAVRLTKYVLGVADLDRTYAFYHALGLELTNGASALNKPNALSEPLLKLVDVPAGTKFRNMMLNIPGVRFTLEVTEFSNMDLHPVRPRIQDPGASLFTLMVEDIDAALALAKKEGAEVVTPGGSPVTGKNRRVVIVKDPDGYYVQLAQASAAHSGSGKSTGAEFGSVVRDSEKTAAFYRDRFGFVAQNNSWTDFSAAAGTPGAQVRVDGAAIAGLSWSFVEFKGVNREAYTPRIPDPGAPAIGLEVRDIDAAIAAVKAAGGTSITQGGSIKLGNNKVGFVRDPSGVLVELTQR